MRTIARRGWTFTSRADGSGTWATERRLWKDIGVDPTGAPWYLETGQGMGLTLQVADQRRAFVLTELGAYLAADETFDLDILPVEDPRLANPYHAIVVAGSAVSTEAGVFVDWLLSEDGQAAVHDLNVELFGEDVYTPSR
jgi:tungstate transport system substrate-binding protein